MTSSSANAENDICLCGAPMSRGICSVLGCVCSKVAQLSESELSQFTGTNEWFRHLVPGVTFTEGARYVAEVAGAYWLIDAIASYQLSPRMRAQPFQTWVLTVSGSTARLVCDDGNGNKLVEQEITFTDFPIATIKFFCCDKVIMLPSEY